MVRPMLALVAAAMAALASAAAQTPAPQWFLDDIEFQTRDGGRWIASNADYVGDNEPADAYGTQWTASFDGMSMRDRLFGLKDGEEIGTYWEFRQYWRPDTGEAIVEQFGWGGAVGVGVMRPWADGWTESEQQMLSPSGPATTTGHRTHNPDADTHVTDSFDIVDGEWRANRSYTWKRQPADN